MSAGAIEQCPDCGCDEYYIRITFSGRGVYHFRFDGGSADNTHLHDTLNYRETTTRYCGQCDRKLPGKHTEKKK